MVNRLLGAKLRNVTSIAWRLHLPKQMSEIFVPFMLELKNRKQNAFCRIFLRRVKKKEKILSRPKKQQQTTKWIAPASCRRLEVMIYARPHGEKSRRRPPEVKTEAGSGDVEKSATATFAAQRKLGMVT